MNEFDAKCPLCKRENITIPFPLYEDDKCWITHDVNKLGFEIRILAVLKKHTSAPSFEEMKYVEEKLKMVANKEFDNQPYEIDRQMRTVPEHWHIQAQWPIIKR